MKKSWFEDVLAGDLTKAHIDYKREYVFHPTRKWRFDFALPEHHIAVEVEGGVWVEGRHNRPQGFEEDCIKYNEAVLLGWRVLRFTSEQVEDNIIVPMVKQLIGEDPDGD